MAVACILIYSMLIGVGGAQAQSASTPPAVPGTVAGSATGAAKYLPTEIQKLKLDNDQKDAVIVQQQMTALQQQLQQLQGQFQAKLKALTDLAEDIKHENHWADTVTFNPNDNTFADPPKPNPAVAPTNPPTPTTAPATPAPSKKP